MQISYLSAVETDLQLLQIFADLLDAVQCMYSVYMYTYKSGTVQSSMSTIN